MRLALVQLLVARLLGRECGIPAAASWSIRAAMAQEGLS